ncbi:hypothetical protein I2F27_11500 [Acinetobacter sp. B5B]|uniref:hypothetical protein n=1 Tax=Acinetobacter baretiae TaxID=2605383 RepID=UPI0018C2B674|nr:hypothetical protein [Acinetobacter baretiae]MBF7683943.1 hypothetical protein [Acinetobacter baretiae]
MDITFFKPQFKSLSELMPNKKQPYQTPRQRVWLAIRNNADEFTIQQVADLGDMKYDSTRDFLTGLRRAGVIKELRRERKPYSGSHIHIIFYTLVNDMGYTAPSVDRQGNILTPRPINKAMWNTLRITKQPLNAHELASLSSNDELSVSTDTADRYLRFLHEAGYLKIAIASHHAVRKAKYMLLPHMNTGAKPPQVQRVKQVFDPNLNETMYSERPELDEEAQHGVLGSFYA